MLKDHKKQVKVRIIVSLFSHLRRTHEQSSVGSGEESVQVRAVWAYGRGAASPARGTLRREPHLEIRQRKAMVLRNGPLTGIR